MTAELQASCVEYGFCHRFDDHYTVEEATRKLDGIAQRLDMVEKCMDTQTAAAIADLHDVMALQHGVQQAISEDNMAKIQSKYDAITQRITRLENNICKEKITRDSRLFQEYVSLQKVLQKEFVAEIAQFDSSETINSHMIHPGTRAWLIERLHNFYVDRQKRLFFLAGKSGAGKTAMAATMCKLYGSDVIANHFFDSSRGASQGNHVTGLIQSLAADMCRTFPEYLTYLNETYGGNAELLANQLSGDWERVYHVLLKDPITGVFGSGPKASPGRYRCNDSRRHPSFLTRMFGYFRWEPEIARHVCLPILVLG